MKKLKIFLASLPMLLIPVLTVTAVNAPSAEDASATEVAVKIDHDADGDYDEYQIRDVDGDGELDI